MNTERYYAIFLTEFFHSCGTTYAKLRDTKDVPYTNREGNRRYREEPSDIYCYTHYARPHADFEGSALKFRTAEEAVAKAKELQEKGVFPKGQGAVAFPTPVHIKVGEVSNYSNQEKVISILQRPLSDVIGDYRAFAVTFAEEHPEFRYDNEHRYQLARSERGGWKYLIYDRNTKAMEWTEDCTKATLFTEDEQEKVAEYANKIGSKENPYKGYVQAMNLPAHHDNPPKFKKGDLVRYTVNGKVCEYKVCDIISFGKGWRYEVGSDYHQGGYSIPQERFFETSPFTDLFGEEELTLVKRA